MLPRRPKGERPDIALVLPPLTQLNTPYPSTAYLAQFLGQHGITSQQHDLGLALVLRLFSRDGLTRVFDTLAQADELPEPAWRALALRDAHLRAVEPVMRFLQGKDSALAPRILDTPFLPMGPAFEHADVTDFGSLGTHDAARYLATLYLKDLANLVTATIDPGFGLARYQHHLALGAQQFDPLYERLHRSTLVDELLDELIADIDAPVVGLSVAFPGNLYGALRIGRAMKARGATVLMGGGYVNTELRDVDEPRLWEFVDALTYDDGEGPLLAFLDWHGGGEDRRHRTRTRDGLHNAPVKRVPFTPAGDYGELPLGDYLQLIDTLNPAHRLWADGRWNKLTLAHGCYWRKCSFCDVNLDYIQHYETTSASALVDHMERLIEQTGQRGFHFVDEAAPPKALKAVALELLKRDLGVSIWGNIRFEKAFTPDLCRLLAAAGLIAVTGGLEVANERLLERIRKGVTVPQVARAAAAFRDAGVMVHAYLMYGFPTQTVQETVDSMEMVRQLFQADLVNSAFWHRFVLTRHAPIFQEQDTFNVVVPPQPHSAFAANDVPHDDPTGADHDRFDDVLVRSLHAWMRGHDLERPVHTWGKRLPRTTVEPGFIERAVSEPQPAGERLVWVGSGVLHVREGLELHMVDGVAEIACDEAVAEWLDDVITRAKPGGAAIRFKDVATSFPGDWHAFAEQWSDVRQAGLLLV